MAGFPREDMGEQVERRASRAIYPIRRRAAGVKLPGPAPWTYSVYVDERDMVWLSDFDSNLVLRFDPENEKFEVFALTSNLSNVRQILGRVGEVWLPESAADQLVRIRY